MSTFQAILIGGSTLGVVQLAVGVLVGMRLGRRRVERENVERASQSAQESTDGADLDSVDQERATQLAADLRNLTASIPTSVRRHNAAIESIDQRLRAESETALKEDGNQHPSSVTTNNPLTNLVVGIVGEMLSANQSLRRDLDNAEAELERQADELAEHRRQSMTDPLTGLPNRRALDDHLRARIDAWRKHATPFSALMLDIDHFKKFNDTYGHQAGDKALQQFGQAIRNALRKHDVVARYGGEEFAVLLPHATLEESEAAINKVRAAIAELRIELEDAELAITASGGLAGITPHETGDALIGRADQALYAAKEAGRNRVYLHNGETCVPLSEGAQPAATDSQPDELQQACTDLRTGLQDFLSQPTSDDQLIR